MATDDIPGLPDGREIGDRWPTFPPLTDAEREEVNRRYDKFEAESAAHAEAYAAKLERVARSLGRRVALGEVLVEDAELRLDAVTYELDPTVPVPLGLLVPEVARDIAATAFAEGVAEARRGGEHRGE